MGTVFKDDGLSVIVFRCTRVFKNNDLPDTLDRRSGGGNLKPETNGGLDLSTKVGNDPLFGDSVEDDLIDITGCHHHKREFTLAWYVPD